MQNQAPGDADIDRLRATSRHSRVRRSVPTCSPTVRTEANTGVRHVFIMSRGDDGTGQGYFAMDQQSLSWCELREIVACMVAEGSALLMKRQGIGGTDKECDGRRGNARFLTEGMPAPTVSQEHRRHPLTSKPHCWTKCPLRYGPN
jgi:hypothetical protein